ncbi:anti-sigma regulatory factor (Ser/Thr protein kinase) [Cytobacillus eiseniae]|uniref:Anti-sigma regulatory factor (Ser/Thr protein kinase) n=1 Tax=Cytobacillus eiseniae TaxID=762947 RepID=A0ABS4R9C1_9BACI|nr:ATP-binding protein [Cytobacillus eiseniae]MBP2239481.1 anti-sigma regulatory factor (Ser/Thr protein kinase) [Cytobacillus eiseniae]
MCNYQLRFRTIEEYCALRCAIKKDIQKILGEENSFFMEVAINEAVNNALRANDSKEVICFNLRVSANNRLIIRIKDHGEGFDVNKAWMELSNSDLFEDRLFNESGRGLSIIHLAVDKMVFNKKGNELLLMKYITPNINSVTKKASIEVFA